MTQPKLRKFIIGLSVVLIVGGSYAVGRLDAPEPNAARIERVGFERGQAEADRRYEQGLAAGRSETGPGTTKYERIYDSGVAAGRRKAKATASAAYAKGLTAGEAKIEERYDDGHVDGYNEGYEEGYDAGLAGEPFDDSDNDAATDVQGDNDLDADDTYGGEYGDDRPDVGYDLDCADFDAPVTVSPGDPHDLDRDGDGIGCDA
jgi:hypothetical protein